MVMKYMIVHSTTILCEGNKLSTCTHFLVVVNIIKTYNSITLAYSPIESVNTATCIYNISD